MTVQVWLSLSHRIRTWSVHAGYEHEDVPVCARDLPMVVMSVQDLIDIRYSIALPEQAITLV